MHSDAAVIVRGIRKRFGDVAALDDVSFDVGRGEVIGLLGPNGAGKTTMVDILSTLTRPDEGSATVAGHDVVSDPAGVRASIFTVRGFFASGTSFVRSIQRRPFSSVAPVTRTWSASWKRREKERLAMPRWRRVPVGSL